MKYKEVFSESLKGLLARGLATVTKTSRVEFGDGSEISLPGHHVAAIAHFVDKHGGNYKNQEHLKNAMWTHVRDNPKDLDRYRGAIESMGGSFERD